MKHIIKISLLLIIFNYACNRDMRFDTSPDFKLQFSTDSVIFDTIFSGVASATRQFKVYNTSSKDVEISRIYLAKNELSNYSINIDGSPLKSSNNVLLKSKDSMYVFVEVLINTNKDALLVKDSVVFQTNGNRQDIKLIAWGQDVNVIDNEVIKTSTWTNKKPYLIYNSVLVDTNSVLNIEQGTKIYFHKGSKMRVAGSINIEGTVDDPVLLKADRLEKAYQDVPGQWEGIHLLDISENNRINYAEIKNAFTGIKIENIADISETKLNLHNTKIQHCSYAGILSKSSKLFATNCVIIDCGYYLLSFSGGSCDFYNCTFANYWQNTVRNTASVALNNYYKKENSTIVGNIDNAGFYNCIVYGNKANEVYINILDDKGYINYEFKNCLLKYNGGSNVIKENMQNCFNKDPLFVDLEKYNFALDTVSPAINKASRQIIDMYPSFLYKDIKDISRISDDAPDIGAYEFIMDNG